MITRQIALERLEPISEESIRYERAMRVRNYFEDRKEAERVKIKKRETVVRNINSGKFDHIFKR
jgi:hypothetical protein